MFTNRTNIISFSYLLITHVCSYTASKHLNTALVQSINNLGWENVSSENEEKKEYYFLYLADAK